MTRAAIKLLSGLLVALAGLVPLASQTAYAASASMSLSAGSSSVAKGSYVTIFVRENSGAEPVNGVQANFSYNASLVQYVSISSSSAFSVVAQNSGGGGSVSIGRGALPAVSGNQLVASVLFKALTNSGTATFAFTGGSSVVSANTNTDIATSKTGASVTLTNPAPAPAPAPKDTTPPTISAVTVTTVTTTTATVTWTTNEAASSEVDYGISTAYGLTAVAGGLAISHSVVLNSAIITPGTMYHFMVKGADASGNVASSKDATFSTKGADIVVLVTDSATGQPISGAKVSWNDESATTNAQGKASLSGLPVGRTVLVLNAAGSTMTETVIIAAPTATPQVIAFKAKLASNQPPFTISAVVIVTAVLVAGVWFMTRKGVLLAGMGFARQQTPVMPSPGAVTPNTMKPEAAGTTIRPTDPPADNHPHVG